MFFKPVHTATVSPSNFFRARSMISAEQSNKNTNSSLNILCFKEFYCQLSTGTIRKNRRVH